GGTAQTRWPRPIAKPPRSNRHIVPETVQREMGGEVGSGVIGVALVDQIGEVLRLSERRISQAASAGGKHRLILAQLFTDSFGPPGRRGAEQLPVSPTILLKNARPRRPVAAQEIRKGDVPRGVESALVPFGRRIAGIPER